MGSASCNAWTLLVGQRVHRVPFVRAEIRADGIADLVRYGAPVAGVSRLLSAADLDEGLSDVS